MTMLQNAGELPWVLQCIEGTPRVVRASSNECFLGKALPMELNEWRLFLDQEMVCLLLSL